MKKKINVFFTWLLLLLVIVGVTLFLKINTYTHDDWWAGFYYFKFNFVNNFMHSDQGLVWSWFTGKLCTQLIPQIFHIHPQQNIITAIIKGINFAIFIYLASAFFNISTKKIPDFFVVLANTFLVFSVIFIVDYHQLVWNNQHFKYLYNLIIGSSIWLVWFREFMKGQFLSGKYLIRDCIFAFILVFTGHLVNIPSIIMFLCLFVYMVYNAEKHREFFISTIKRNYFIPLIYITCCITYVNMPGFTYIKKARWPEGSAIVYAITHFWEFTELFFKQVFGSKYIAGLFLITVIGIIAIIILRKRIDKKYIIASIAIFLGNLAFQYSLLFCGKTYYDQKSYWFVSPQIAATFLFYLIINCNIIFGCIYNLIEKTNIKVYLTVGIFMLINIIYPISVSQIKVMELYEKEKIQRVAIYKISKIFRYYALTSDTIYVPLTYYPRINVFPARNLWAPVNHNIYTILYKKTFKPREIEVNLKYTYKPVIDNMILVYKIDKNKKFEPMNKRILNDAELFPKEELDNINFNNLYNDSFVLQMKEPEFDN